MPGSDFSVALIWDILWKTAFVLVILYCVLWAIRCFSGGQLVTRKDPSISVVETAHLGPGRAVHLVNVGNRTILLGATSHQVSLLVELAPTDLECSIDVVQENRSFDRYLQQAKGLMVSISTRVKSKNSFPASIVDETSETKE